MIEISGLASQDREVMQRVQKHLTVRIRTCVPRDDLPLANDVDAIHICLDQHSRKRITFGNTIAAVLPGHRLILVDLACLGHTSVERALGQRQRVLLLGGETLSDRALFAADGALLILLTTIQQVRV